MRIVDPRRFWTQRRTLAAQLVAEGESIPSIAARVRRSEFWVDDCKRNPLFQERVQSIVEETRAALLTQGIAIKAERIAAQNDRWRRLQQVRAERAADPTLQNVPGGRTGLIVHRLKMIGSGKNAILADEYEVDVGSLAEERAIERAAAEELGDITRRVEVEATLKREAKRIADETGLDVDELVASAERILESRS